jgi:hypothetical protein
MSIQELKDVLNYFEDFSEVNGKMKTFHNKETGEAIVIIYNPNILGITKLRDLLVLSKEELRNLDLYYKSRDLNKLMQVLKCFRKLKQ